MTSTPRATLQRHFVTGNPDGRDVLESQRQAQRLMDQLYVLAPWLNGQLLSTELDANGHKLDGISFAAGVAKSIPHRLGKTYRGGWAVRDFGTNASNIRESASDERTVTLVSTVDCKIYWWAWG